MKEKIINRLLRWQRKNGLIKAEDYNLYKYAYDILFRKIIIYLIVIITALAIKNVVEISIFLIVFIMLRQYTGGIHLKKEWSCIALSSVTIILCSIYLTNKFPITKIQLCLWGIAIIIIVLLSPAESANKKLDEIEIKIYRIRSYAVLAIEVIITILLGYITDSPILQSTILAHLLVSIGLVISHFHKIFYVTKT